VWPCAPARAIERERERGKKRKRDPRAAFAPARRRTARVPFRATNAEELPKREKRGKNLTKKIKKLHTKKDAPELLNPCFAVTLPFSADKRVRFTDARTYALFFFTHCHTSSEEHSTCDLTIFFFSYFLLFCVNNEVFFFFLLLFFVFFFFFRALFFFCLLRLKNFFYPTPHDVYFRFLHHTKESIFFTTQVKGGQRDAYINTQRARNKIRGPTQTRKDIQI